MMAKYIKGSDDKTITAYSDTGEFQWSYNPNHSIKCVDVAKENIVCGYKFIVTDYGCGFVYVGGDNQ